MRTVRVVGAALLLGERCLVARRSARMSEPLRWEFPGGKVEPGETDEQSLARELSEELGIEVTVGQRLGESEAVVADRRLCLVVYAVDLRRGTPVALEHDAVEWFAADELAALDWAPLDVPIVSPVVALLRAR